MYSWVAMSSRSAGSMLLASAYIASRQVQKLSCAPMRNSVSPTMARWNAWLCAFGIPGTTLPRRRCGAGGSRARGARAGDGRDEALLGDADHSVALPAGSREQRVDPVRCHG